MVVDNQSLTLPACTYTHVQLQGVVMQIDTVFFTYRLDDELMCPWEFRSPRKPGYRRPKRKAQGIYLVSKVI